MNKILSISIAAYNVEKVIAECIESFLPSKYINQIELIVVDDGSKDNTAKIVKKYSEHLPDNIIYVPKENGGHGSTINKALAMAKGRFFKVVDGDDWIDVVAFDNMIEMLRDTRADLVINDYVNIYPDSDTPNLYHHTLPEGLEHGIVYSFQDAKVSYKSDSIAMAAETIRTESLRKYWEPLTEKRFYVDVEYILRVLAAADTIVYAHGCIYHARSGYINQSVSASNRFRHFEDELNLGLTLPDYIEKYYDKLPHDGRREMMISVWNRIYRGWFNLAASFSTDEKDELLVQFDSILHSRYSEFVQKNARLGRYTIIRKNIRTMIKIFRIVERSKLFHLAVHIKHKLFG